MGVARFAAWNKELVVGGGAPAFGGLVSVRTSLLVAVTLTFSVTAVACYKVPYTERRPVSLVPDGMMRSLGRQSYSDMLQGKRILSSGADAAVLERVGKRISTVADQPKYDWQFSLIDENTINAWCLPGGYIGFYTGILPVLQNEAGMAFVMGHEVGHATARHGAERLSQNLAIMGGLGALELYLTGSGKMSDDQRGMLLGALGLGAQVGVLLPFSRSHESEADVVGLMYMAGAGYPPEESIKVWDRMGKASGEGGPSWLSTHPSNDARQDKLREWMPEAKKRYARSKLPGDMLETIWRGTAGGSSPKPPAGGTGGSGTSGSSGSGSGTTGSGSGSSGSGTRTGGGNR
jgi:predicted Zn-dependent protease